MSTIRKMSRVGGFHGLDVCFMEYRLQDLLFIWCEDLGDGFVELWLFLLKICNRISISHVLCSEYFETY